MTEWIFRQRPRGVIVTCCNCGNSISGQEEDVARLQNQHDPAACAARAKTPEAKRLKGTR